MQTRRMLIALLSSVVVFYLWMIIANKLWPPPAKPPATASQPASLAPADQRPGSTQPGTTTQPGMAATTPADASAAGKPIVIQGSSREPVVMGDATEGNPYPMMLKIMPEGARVSTAKIRGHYETVQKKDPYTIIHPVLPEKSRELYAFPTSLRFEDRKLDVSLEDSVWQLSPDSDKERMIWTVDIRSPQNEPLARVSKTFELRQQAPEKMTYDFGLSVEVKNLTGAPMQVIVIQYGPLGFRKEDMRIDDRKIVGAAWKGDEVTAKGHTRDEVFKHNKVEIGADKESSRVAWAAETNKYFTCIMAPAGRTSGQDDPRFASVEAVHLGDTTESAQTELSALTFQYITTPRQIPADGTEKVAFNCYLGPKSKRAFDIVPAYEQLDYYWVIRESFQWCAPTSLVRVMMWLLNAFHKIPPHNYGLAIIILVLVVRLILHPITKKSQVNLMKMQKQMATLQPRIEAAKQKYANDRVQMNQAVMEVYREAGVNPAGNILTCLPMFLQVPIWGALWTALSSTIEMRHSPFDPWWIRDLAGEDAVIRFSQPISIPLLGFIMGGPIHSINLLPVLLGISQVLQAKYMPHANRAAASTQAADQMEQQRKMMMFMSVFFVLFLYNAPSGLNLYIMASNFFGILEQWRIRKHLADEEKRLAALPPQPAGGPKKAGEPRKPSWLQRKWKELEKHAEEARRIQSQRDDKKDRDDRKGGGNR